MSDKQKADAAASKDPKGKKSKKGKAGKAKTYAPTKSGRMNKALYEEELFRLQAELVEMQGG